MAAAGCAFYAMLALFPAISMLVSVYGLFLNPITAEQQLAVLATVMPGPAYGLVEDRIHQLVHQSGNTLSLNLLIGLLLACWSSASGSKSVISAVDIAYHVTERRGVLRFQAVSLGMMLIAVLCAILGIVVLLGLPAVIGFLGLSSYAAVLIHLASMAMLIGLFFVAMVLLYRFGPSRRRPRHQPLNLGALLATVLWVLASECLSLYVAHMGSFGATYGSLGAVVGVMLWFYLSAYAALLGAELNAQLERA